MLKWGPGRKDGMKSRMKLGIVLPLPAMMGREVDIYSLGHLDRWKVLSSSKMFHSKKDVVALALLSEIPDKCCSLLYPS